MNFVHDQVVDRRPAQDLLDEFVAPAVGQDRHADVRRAALAAAQNGDRPGVDQPLVALRGPMFLRGGGATDNDPLGPQQVNRRQRLQRLAQPHLVGEQDPRPQHRPLYPGELERVGLRPRGQTDLVNAATLDRRFCKRGPVIPRPRAQRRARRRVSSRGPRPERRGQIRAARPPRPRRAHMRRPAQFGEQAERVVGDLGCEIRARCGVEYETGHQGFDGLRFNNANSSSRHAGSP